MRGPWSALPLVLAGIALSASFAFAAALAAPTFGERIDVRAVDVFAIVTDHKGRRVKDLKAEDFRLLVDGREERIDSFSEVREGQTEPTAPAIPAASAASASAERVGTNYLVFIDDALALRVEVRRPELTARARGRFFDLSPATNSALTAESVLSLGGDPARKRLVVTAGVPRRSGREGMDLPVTFAIPSELLARVPGTVPGYPVEGSLAVAAMDVAGRLISVPGQILHGTLPEEPRPGVFVRIRSVLHLRRAQQRLVFTVTGTEERPIWSELEVKP